MLLPVKLDQESKSIVRVLWEKNENYFKDLKNA